MHTLLISQFGEVLSPTIWNPVVESLIFCFVILLFKNFEYSLNFNFSYKMKGVHDYSNSGNSNYENSILQLKLDNWHSDNSNSESSNFDNSNFDNLDSDNSNSKNLMQQFKFWNPTIQVSKIKFLTIDTTKSDIVKKIKIYSFFYKIFLWFEIFNIRPSFISYFLKESV